MNENPTKERKRPRGKGTGSIFKPKGSSYWWIAYVSGGKRRYESTKSTRKGDAQDLLTLRTGDVKRGIVVTPKMGKITLAAGLKAHVDDLRMNKRKSVADAQRRIDLHLLKFFDGSSLMANMGTGDVERYKVHRIDEGAENATINRELACLRRAFRLAYRGKELAAIPHVPMLTEHNTRKGFFERAQFDAILAHLPAHVRAPLRFDFNAGWRLGSEVLSLTVDQVRLDRDAGAVTLHPGETKTGDARTIYFGADDELYDVLTERLASVEAFKAQGKIVPWVFHKPDGSRMKDFRKRWRTACRKAGYPGKLFHDFRRTAVRNFERSRTPRSAAMQMVGHKTESIYRRYAIHDEASLREAAAQHTEWKKAQTAEAKAEGTTGQIVTFPSDERKNS